MGRVMRALVVSWVMALLPGMAWGAELRFITIDAAPWASVNEKGHLIGAFPEIVSELARRTGLAIRPTVRPFARIDRELETGLQDCTIILWNDRRARIVERGEDVYLMRFGVIARRDLVLDDYGDLAPLIISVTRNLRIDARFDADEKLTKDFDKDYAAGIRKIAHGRLDAVAGALPTIRYIADQIGLADQLGKSLELNSTPLALQCSRNSPSLGRMPALNEAIRAMRADGTMQRIMARNGY